MEDRNTCSITGKEYPESDLVSAKYMRKEIYDILKKSYPDWNGKGYVSVDILNEGRNIYLKQLLEKEKGELNDLDKEVLKSLQTQETLTRNIELEVTEQMTIGQRIADNVADFGGSWTFIILFLSIILVWIIFNAYILITHSFDPYPFILLNLVLSCVAALQAPVIMMSQNRQEDKDRLRAQNDYKVNLKAELEIRQINEKVDHLLLKQDQRLFEIQELQIDMLEDILKKLNHNHDN